MVVKESPDRIVELERWGAIWNKRPDGALDIYQIAGHSIRGHLHREDE